MLTKEEKEILKLLNNNPKGLTEIEIKQLLYKQKIEEYVRYSNSN